MCHYTTAHDVNADNYVYAVRTSLVLKKRKLLAALTTFQTTYCSQACVSVQIRHYRCEVYNGRFSHLDSDHELEDNVVDFITQKKKQANFTESFHVK